ncbi:MAG: sulfotransferase [Planctomycetales bacterium]|nr:sulfotransferase [Planctomycetales bacterium]
MEIDHSSLEALLDYVCSQVRVSVRQSREAVVQQSWQRLAANSHDRPARHVVAASSLLHQQPVKTLELLGSDFEDFSCHPVSNRLAGYAWLARNDLHLARNYFDQSVRLDPNQPDCWNWLGRIAEEDHEFDQASEYYERGMMFDDGGHDSALALSQLQVKNRNIADAIHTLRVCLIRDQRSPKLNLALAKLLGRRAILLGRRRKYLAQQRLRQEALECYRTVNAAAPSSESLVMQGRLEQLLFDHKAAIESFQKAVALNPKSAGALCHLASANVDFGEIEDAITHFEQSLSLDPNRADTHFRYTRAKRFQPDRDSRAYIQQLEHQLAQSHAKSREFATNQGQRQIYLNFALAKVYDDTRDFDKAWLHYDAANRLKTQRSLVSINQSRDSRESHSKLGSYADRAMDRYTPAYFHVVSGLGNPSRTPIFIVGMPRSGTTLTEQILSSHPDVAGAGELTYINQIRQEISLGQQRKPEHTGCDSLAPLSGLDPSEIRRHADHYLSQLDRFRTDEQRVTDKMPTNFMHLGLIATLFPGATVIHCRRNPMDVFVSCYCQNLNAPFCDLEQLVDYHRQYRRLMAHWERVLPINIYTNDYESLVAEPEMHTRALIEHCGLKWNDDCMRFHANHRAVHTPSKWQVRQPMYQSSVEKWRRFEKHLAPIAEQVFAEMQQSVHRKIA